MAVCLGDLEQRDLARLRTELVEVIAARFTYPAYYDFRAGAARVRPIGDVRRQEIAGFVQAIILEPLARVEIGAPEVRRFLEQVFARHVELNPELARAAAKRRVPAMRATIPQAAAEVQRGLVAFAAGAPGNFGAPRPATSWVGTAQTSVHRTLDWTLVERGTMLLQTALSTPPGTRSAALAEATPGYQPAAAQAPSQPAAHLATPTARHSSPNNNEQAPVGEDESTTLPPWLVRAASDPAPRGFPPAPPPVLSPEPPPASTSAWPVAQSHAANGRGTSQLGADAWASVPREETAPLPAHLMQLNRSLFAGLESGSQSGIFGLDEELGFSDMPTGPQPSVGLDGMLAEPQEIPPDLIALYSEYLRDLQPGGTTATRGSGASGRGNGYALPGAHADAVEASDMPAWARAPVVSARPPAATRAGIEAAATEVMGVPANAPRAGDDAAAADRAIFAQLRQQLEAYLRQTARHYGVRLHGTDGAEALAALRVARILDESDLRLAEGILALSGRVLAGQPATLEDFRQAFMLYLLYHRRQVGV